MGETGKLKLSSSSSSLPSFLSSTMTGFNHETLESILVSSPLRSSLLLLVPNQGRIFLVQGRRQIGSVSSSRSTSFLLLSSSHGHQLPTDSSFFLCGIHLHLPQETQGPNARVRRPPQHQHRNKEGGTRAFQTLPRVDSCQERVSFDSPSVSSNRIRANERNPSISKPQAQALDPRSWARTLVY